MTQQIPPGDSTLSVKAKLTNYAFAALISVATTVGMGKATGVYSQLARLDERSMAARSDIDSVRRLLDNQAHAAARVLHERANKRGWDGLLEKFNLETLTDDEMPLFVDRLLEMSADENETKYERGFAAIVASAIEDRMRRKQEATAPKDVP